MALILGVEDHYPKFGDNCWFADNSTIVGDVILGKENTVWFNAVIRGDVNSIRLGDRVNIQDGAVIHCTYQKTKTIIGNDVSIAHNAIVHGCTIEDQVLIGMGAIVMDGAYIGKNSIIGAGTIITANTRVEPGTIWAGNPGKFLKNCDENAEELILRTAKNYIMYAKWFQNN